MKDYKRMKERLAADLQGFRAASQRRDRDKVQLAEEGKVSAAEIEALSSYYLVIESFKRISPSWLEELHSYFSSISFKVFFDFNRQVIVSIDGNDRRSFIDTYEKITTHSPAAKFHPDYPHFKLIKSFRFYETADRLDPRVAAQTPHELIVRYFDVSARRQETVDAFLERYFDLTHLNKFFAEARPKDGIDPSEGLRVVSKTVDDLALISPSIIEVTISPKEGIQKATRYTLSPEYDPSRKLEIVGILDSGISSNRDVLMQINRADLNKSIVDDKPLVDAQPNGGHGTGVASLVAFGEQIVENKTQLLPDAKVVSIKVLSSGGGMFGRTTVPDLLKEFQEKGVRLFNMSVNFPSEIKEDNSNVSEFAYWIDYLLAQKKYQNILLCVSAGNVDNNSLIPPDLRFSSLFGQYHLNHHFHWGTNILSPADANSIVAVGAIKNTGFLCEFSRKDSLDYAAVYKSKKGSGSTRIATSWLASFIGKSHRKPDLLTVGEGVNVLSSDFTAENTDQDGTSFAAPQVCNIAASIWNAYPSAKANTVKALLLNSCASDDMKLEAQISSGSVLPDKIRDRVAEFGSDQEKKEMDSLRKRCFGYGMPIKDRAINSDESRVTILVEDEIGLNMERCYKIQLPTSNIFRGKGLFRISSTLVYNHIPIFSDHLNYNPILISYRIIRDQPDLHRLETEYDALKREEPTGSEALAALKEKIKVQKKKIDQYVIQGSWSQDNQRSQQYSNIQRFENDFTKSNLSKKTENGSSTLYLEVRCNIKSKVTNTNIFHELKDFIEKEQGVVINRFEDLERYYKPQFSLAIAFEDLAKEDQVAFYNDFLTANADSLIELDAQAEAVVDV